MIDGIYTEILEWFNTGADFDAGIVLLSKVSSNHYYINNIARARRDSTIRYELGKVLVKAGIVKRQPIVMNARVIYSQTVAPAKLEPVEVTPAPVRKQVNIRETFPFLKDKKCPQEFKILVADMLTAHGEYVDGHGELFEVAHKGEKMCFEAAQKTFENFKENRLIWKELEHYKQHGKILGEHPIFTRRKKLKQLAELTMPELVNRRVNLNRQLRYREKLIKAKKTDDVAARKEEMKDLKWELSEVERLIKSYVGK